MRALGPSGIARTGTARLAREALAERERAGRPFDWLYADKACGGAEAVLRGPGPRRRRRAGAGGPRVLTDEVVIQSLILGRMVEADEMTAA